MLKISMHPYKNPSRVDTLHVQKQIILALMTKSITYLSGS